jgi:membrane protein
MNILKTKNKAVDFFTRGLWEIDLRSLNRFKSSVIKFLRLANVIIEEFSEGQLTLRAMSLVYTVLLSIVPVLAIGFSVLKAFGVHNEIVEPFLLKFLAPMGTQGEEITMKIIGFVENMKVGILGSLGLAMLFYTVISVIQKIEKSFNYIWRINKTRNLSRRFSDYISVLIIGPVLIFSALGITASFMSNTIVQKIISIEPMGTMFYYAVEILPYIIVCGAFTFFYVFIPNTKVKLKSAIVGGIFAGIMWETAGWGFASFIVTSTKYAAIYSGFAILIMFMIWVYVSWLILLLGAQISFYHQYPNFVTAKKDLFRISNRLRERSALLVMYFIGHNFLHDKKPWTLDTLVERLKLPVDPIHEIISLLEQNGFLRETNDEPPAYIPARDMETISLKQLISAVRTGEKEALTVEKKILSKQEVDRFIKKMDNALADAAGHETLKDLVISSK